MKKQMLVLALIWAAWAFWRDAQPRPFHVLMAGQSRRVSCDGQGLRTLAGLARQELMARDQCLENLLNVDNCCRLGAQPYRRRIDTGDFKWVYEPSHPFAIPEGSHKGYLPLPNLNVDREFLELASHERLYLEYRSALRQLQRLCPDYAIVEPVSPRSLELVLQCRTRFAMQRDNHRQNLANLHTTAYRCRSLFFEGSQIRTLVHQSQGALKQTGRPLDFGLDDNGKGYFVVQAPEGLEYTRDGHFHRSSSGHLVTFDGNFVLSDRGPVQSPFDEQGRLSTGGRLRIARCLDATNFQPLQSGRFRGAVEETADFRVKQGTLEQANFSPQVEEFKLQQSSALLEEVRQLKLIP